MSFLCTQKNIHLFSLYSFFIFLFHITNHFNSNIFLFFLFYLFSIKPILFIFLSHPFMFFSFFTYLFFLLLFRFPCQTSIHVTIIIKEKPKYVNMYAGISARYDYCQNLIGFLCYAHDKVL